jgi:hypothetical protein
MRRFVLTWVQTSPAKHSRNVKMGCPVGVGVGVGVGVWCSSNFEVMLMRCDVAGDEEPASRVFFGVEGQCAMMREREPYITAPRGD